MRRKKKKGGKLSSGAVYRILPPVTNKTSKGTADILSFAVNWILLLTAVYGFLLTAAVPLALPFNHSFIFWSLFTVGGCLLLLFRFIRYGKFLLPAAVLIYGLAFSDWFTEIQTGASLVCIKLSLMANEYYGTSFSQLTIPEVNGNEVTIFFVFLMLLPLALTAYTISGGSRAWYLFSAVGFWLLPLALGQLPGTFGIVLSLCSAPAIMAGKWKERSLGPPVRAAVAGMSALLLCLCTVFFPESRYQEKIHLGEWKEEIRQVSRDIADNIDWRNPFGFSVGSGKGTVWSSGGLNHGKVGQTDEVRFLHQEEMKLTVPSQLKGPFYLKGYTGEEYQNMEWTPLSEPEKREYETFMKKYAMGAENLPCQWISLYNMHYYPYMLGVRDILIGKNAKATGAIAVDYVSNPGNSRYVPYNTTAGMKVGRDGRTVLESGYRLDVSYEVEAMPVLSEILFSALEEIEPQYNYSLIMLGGNRINRSNLELIDRAYLEGEAESSKASVPIEQLLEKGIYLGNPATSFRDAVKLVRTVDRYARKENEYRSYVYKVYTRIPENTAVRAVGEWKEQLSAAFQKESNKTKGYSWDNWEVLKQNYYTKDRQIGDMSLADIQLTVRQLQRFLQQKAVYTLSPGKTPKDKDVIDYFLYENKKGYCTYFATAAVILLRSAGIPARYAEGYLASSDELARAVRTGPNEDTLEFSLYDDNAHAWAEIYVNGIGWIPVETTPGYISENAAGFEAAVPKTEEEAEKEKEEKKKEDVAPEQKKDEKNDSSKDLTSDQDQFLNQDKKQESSELRNTLLYWLLAAGIFVFCLLIGAAMTVWRYQSARRYRKRLLQSTDENKKVLYFYRQLDRLCRIRGCYTKQISLEEAVWSKRLYESLLSREQWEECIGCAGKAAFGERPVSETDTALIRSCYEECFSGWFRNLSRGRKIYYSYMKRIF